MGRGNQYTAKQFITVIPGSGGIISTIAARVGCDWNTAKKYITTYPTVAQAYENEREAMLDTAENTIIQSVKEGNTQDAKWLLTKLGRDRGYGDEVALSGNVSVTITAAERIAAMQRARQAEQDMDE